MPTELHSLAKIFNKRFFRIPDYQRGYAWGKPQLDDFWSDLRRVGTARIHYCGQLALESANEAAWRRWDDDIWLVQHAHYKPFFLVDGQQRLTTAIILLQCLLEDLTERDVFAGQRVSELRERYLVKANGVLKSCMFGYAKDNPSHEFFQTKILGVPSNEYKGARTVYTRNLAFARDYFRERLQEVTERADRERLFLKNRLIYLSTLSKGLEPERKKVRANINAVWMTIYEELGRNPKISLNDDFFLRAHGLIERFRFNLHVLGDEIDVFVAFETMNHRGKPLSRLEQRRERPANAVPSKRAFHYGALGRG
jgi:uncharacterized protein with ParB-like and HNH nuclease domain